MAHKKSHRSAAAADDSDDLARSSLQAVLLADSFALKFRPLSLERPKVLLPLANVPMIEYTLAWLESVGVEEVFVFCCAHAQQVRDYLEKSQWSKQSGTFSVTAVESHDAVSAGDALRVIYGQGMIRGDFVLISGDTVSNMSLTQAIQEHKDRRKKDQLAVMTMVVKHSKPSFLTHQTRLGNDEVFMAIDPDTKELLYYDDKADGRQAISLDKSVLENKSKFLLHHDKQDCYIDICSSEVLSLFTDNFDYQHLRRDFVKGLLMDDIMGYKIFTHEIHSSYAARVDNFRSYDTISKDIIQRWTYPFVPNVQYFEKNSHVKLDRLGVYKAPEVVQSRSAQIGAFTLVGNGTTIGDNSKISHSVIGQGCIIGSNVTINGSYIWDNVVIEDNCKLNYALVCDGVHLRSGVVLEPGVILSFKVEVGQQITIPSYSKVSLLPQPSIEDSDEELEYAADTHSAMAESPLSQDYLEQERSEASEVGFSGIGYIWSTSEGHDDEWRHSIAPISAERLLEISQHLEESDVSNLDVNSTQVSGELQPGSESPNADNKDAVDFDKEVEATFIRDISEGVDLETMKLEINALRLSYNMTHSDCAGALFDAVMKLASKNSDSNIRDLYRNASEVISNWKNLLLLYIKSIDEEIEIILRFEEMCFETVQRYSPLFSAILKHLYDQDIVSEDAIFAWADEKAGADERDKEYLKQSEQLIKWLKEAPEEDSQEE